MDKDKTTFLIKSSKTKSFGTGFSIFKDKKGTYLLTCAHVIDECGHDTLDVNGYLVELICIGSRYTIDLAVIYVHGLTSTVLDLIDIRVKDELAFYVNGFRVHLNQNHKLERLEGIVNKCSTLYSKEETVDRYELAIDLDDSIQKGYSGSAIVSSETNKVFAIATTRYNINHAEAIPIEYLFKIWNNIPVKLKKQIQINNKNYLKSQVKTSSIVSNFFKLLFSKILTLLKYIFIFFLLSLVVLIVTYIDSIENASNFNREGEKAYLDNKIDEAISDFNKAIEEKNDFTLAYINLSELYYEQDNEDKALWNAREAIRITSKEENRDNDGNNELVSKAFYSIGIIHEGKDRLEESLEKYKIAFSKKRSVLYRKAIERVENKLKREKERRSLDE